MYTTQKIILDHSHIDKLASAIKVSKTTIEDVYLTYLRSVSDISLLNLESSNIKSSQQIVQAIISNISNITVNYNRDKAVDIAHVIKRFGDERPNKSIIVYTDEDIHVFDKLKRIPNVTPVKYGDNIYTHVIHSPIDYIILLPQADDANSFNKIVKIAHDLSDNQQYILIDNINVIGLGVNLD